MKEEEEERSVAERGEGALGDRPQAGEGWAHGHGQGETKNKCDKMKGWEGEGVIFIMTQTVHEPGRN